MSRMEIAVCVSYAKSYEDSNNLMQHGSLFSSMEGEVLWLWRAELLPEPPPQLAMKVIL